METVYSKLAKIANNDYKNDKSILRDEIIKCVGEAMDNVTLCCYETKKIGAKCIVSYGNDDNNAEIAAQYRGTQDEEHFEHNGRYYIVCKVLHQSYILIFGKDAEFTEFEQGVATYVSIKISNFMSAYDYDQLLVQRLKAAGSLHDIGNILGVVSVYMDMLGTDIDENSDSYGYFETIQDELKKVYELFRNVSNSANESLKPDISEFCIEDLMQNLYVSTKALAGDNIEVCYKPNEHIIMLGDRTRAYRVLLNLVKNAVEALEGKSGRIYLRAKQYGDEVRFTVCDTGKGIEKGEMDKLFRPFYTHGKENGTGLGLNVVRKIINARGGSVKVRSVVGKYTCFIVKVPKDGTDNY